MWRKGGLWERGGSGREEGSAAPFEALRALLPVAGDDDVALVLLLKLSKKVSMEGRSQIESVLSAHTMMLLFRRARSGYEEKNKLTTGDYSRLLEHYCEIILIVVL